MSYNTINPFILSCTSCGASMHFDIIKQNYACEYCGNTEFVDTKKEIVKKWAEKTNKNLQANTKGLKKYECGNCGAEVKTLEDSQTLKCFSCGSSMFLSDFANTDDYPVAIIPFQLTLDEAKDLLKKELNFSLKKLSKKQKEKILNRLSLLREVYLPFQLFTGPVNAKVHRYGKYNEREFNLKSYINQKVVIACENVDNDLIEQIEPYNMDALKPFDFAYIAGHQAKTQDINYANLERDFRYELQDDMNNALSKKLGTEHLDIDVSVHDESSMPVLLPIFTLKTKEISLSINGQTGKIAIKDLKERVSHEWVAMPIIYTAFVSALAFLLSKDIEILVMSAIVFGLFIFAVYSDANRRIIYNKFLSSKQTYSREGRKLAQIGFEAEPTFAKPVFYEKIKGESKPVDVLFYPLRLEILLVVITLVFVFLPEVIYLITSPIFMNSQNMDFNTIVNGLILGWVYTAVWKCISVPISIILYFTFGKQGLYDRVYIRPYGSKQRYKYVKGSFPILKNIGVGVYILWIASKVAAFFIAFVLIISTSLIYTEGAFQFAKKGYAAYDPETEYVDRLDEVFEKTKYALELDDSYKISNFTINDYDADENKDAIAFISKDDVFTHAFFFDLDDEDNYIKDSLVFEDDIAKKLELVDIKGWDSKALYVKYKINDDCQGLALYKIENGKFEKIINVVPKVNGEVTKLGYSSESSSSGYDVINSEKYSYYVFFYNIISTFEINEQGVDLLKSELVIPEDKKVPVTPEEVVQRYIELSILKDDYRWNGQLINIEGLDESLGFVTTLDFDENYIWDGYLVESITLGEEPVVKFESQIYEDRAIVTSKIVGKYEDNAVSTAGDGKLINYELKKIDGKWKIIGQSAVDGTWEGKPVN